jgi:60 kDa SS-A/Ro ribonucleoprotein
VSQVLSALEAAVIYSIRNLKGFEDDTRVLIACDVSGSMQKPISPKSKVLLYDIGLVLGMLMQSKCKRVVTGMFGDGWKIINMPSGNVLSNAYEFYRREGEVGYSTNGYKVIDDLMYRKVKMDKILIFTDCQMWNSEGTMSAIEHSWLAYKAFAPDAVLYLFDLAGLGQTPLRMERNDVFLIAGWSDKVFDVLHAIECGEGVVEKIKAIQLS